MPAKGLADSAAGPMTTTGSDLTTADQGDRTRPMTLPSVSVTVAINLPLQPVDGAAAVAATISGRAPSRTTGPGQRSCWSRVGPEVDRASSASRSRAGRSSRLIWSPTQRDHKHSSWFSNADGPAGVCGRGSAAGGPRQLGCRPRRTSRLGGRAHGNMIEERPGSRGQGGC